MTPLSLGRLSACVYVGGGGHPRKWNWRSKLLYSEHGSASHLKAEAGIRGFFEVVGVEILFRWRPPEVMFIFLPNGTMPKIPFLFQRPQYWKFIRTTYRLSSICVYSII